MSLRLYADTCYPDFKCPSCNVGLSTEWFTEYGEPIDGDRCVTCPECETKFKVQVCTTTKYTVLNG